ncbi:MAG TPA: DNRLRE domain-containing protein [Candidatus Eisenbacteria bacterium]|jgi:hypothetical protein|nr:DNRLRE domain-containing protein [Candidatus Eisenbacteria bacterium]
MTSFYCARRKSFLSLVVILAGASHCYPDTITLPPIADTALFQYQPNNNLGGELTIPVGGNSATDGITNVSRGLIKFAIADSIPSAATITSVKLMVTVVQVPVKQTPVDSVFELRRMLRDWGEGSKRNVAGRPLEGAPAATGEATWNARFYPDVSWSAPGAAAPVDFINSSSATNFIRGTNTYAFDSTSTLIADVQGWLNNPASNFGWLLRSEMETTPLSNRRFASREDTNNAPRLVIDFSLPTANFKFNKIERSGGTINLFFAVEASRSYTVESRKELGMGFWQTLTNVVPPVALSNYVVSDTFSAVTNRFYRLRSP